MAIEFNFKIDPKLLKPTNKFKARYGRLMKRGMFEAVALVETRIKLNLSGPSHTNFPGNGNPYPGVVSGRMRNSVHGIVVRGGNRILGKVGPNVEYAPWQVFGTGRIPPRDFLTPALAKSIKKIVKIFERVAAELLRGEG